MEEVANFVTDASQYFESQIDQRSYMFLPRGEAWVANDKALGATPAQLEAAS
jgi:hypothetical protein